MYKANWLIKTLKCTVKNERILRECEKSAKEYEKSEGLEMKMFECLVSKILYLNPMFKEKSCESHSIWPKRFISTSILLFAIQIYTESNWFHDVLSCGTFRLKKLTTFPWSLSLCRFICLRNKLSKSVMSGPIHHGYRLYDRKQSLYVLKVMP